jgi:hypothetical protein
VQVLTVYVAHDIQAQEDDPLTLDYLGQDPLVREKGLSPEACKKALEEIGFSESQLTLPISAQSGVFLAAQKRFIIVCVCDTFVKHKSVLHALFFVRDALPQSTESCHACARQIKFKAMWCRRLGERSWR